MCICPYVNNVNSSLVSQSAVGGAKDYYNSTRDWTGTLTSLSVTHQGNTAAQGKGINSENSDVKVNTNAPLPVWLAYSGLLAHPNQAPGQPASQCEETRVPNIYIFISTKQERDVENISMEIKISDKKIKEFGKLRMN